MSRTLKAWHDNFRASVPVGATHQCRICLAYWRLNDDESWTLASELCGECCDNEVMGEQIRPLPAPEPAPAPKNEPVGF